VPVVLHLALVDGQYRGTIDAPTESMIGEPLDDVRVDHGSIHFTLASEHGPVDFSGTMTAKRISGTVTHGGGSPMPLTLSKAAPSSQAAALLKVKGDRKSTRLNSSHVATSYAVFCLKKKKSNKI